MPEPAAPSLPIETAPETTSGTVSAGKSAPAQTNVVSSTPRLRQTPSAGRRLPRFARAKRSHRPPLALQDRDLRPLRAAHEYRLISTLTLFASESRDGLYTRLQKLFHHGYLNRLGMNPNAPLVYSLGRRGAEVLGVSSAKDVGDRYVAHQLMVGNVRIALTRASRERGIELSWRPMRQDLPVRPDGFFSLRFPELPEGRNTAHFFLEADRSTMTRERYVEKLCAYAAWQNRGGHTEALGIKAFRVLTVTKSEARLASLLKATRESPRVAGALPIFWFTAAPRCAAEGVGSILGRIWRTGDEPTELRAIIPG